MPEDSAKVGLEIQGIYVAILFSAQIADIS
jgi:hypothetical protein